MRSVITSLLEELENGRSCELVTILSVRGTAPREPGCTMLIGRDGRHLAGTVGGGCIEWQSLKKGMQLLVDKKSGEAVFEHGCQTEDDSPSCGAQVALRFTYCSGQNGRLIGALREAVGSQGGLLRITAAGTAAFIPGAGCAPVFENATLSLYLPPPDRVFLFGAGHVAQALVPLLKPLGFSVTVYDERKDLADRAHFPAAETVLNGLFSDDLVARTGAEPRDYIVIMSATHRSDEEILSHFTGSDFAYIGMLGSRKKAAAIKEHLKEKGVPDARLNSIHIPIGLSIGARTPEEVALSVAAELVKTRAETGNVRD